jgi:hypothetical protein
MLRHFLQCQKSKKAYKKRVKKCMQAQRQQAKKLANSDRDIDTEYEAEKRD